MSKEASTKKKKRKTGRVIGYLIGSTTTFAIASVVIPKYLPKVSGTIIKYINKFK